MFNNDSAWRNPAAVKKLFNARSARLVGSFAALLSSSPIAACDDDPDSTAQSDASTAGKGGSGGAGGAAGKAGAAAPDGGGDAGANDAAAEAGGSGGEGLYAVMTQLASSEEALTYLKLIDKLEPQEITLESRAREFTGGADAWVWDGAVFITEDEKSTVTKFKVQGDELVKDVSINFSEYGPSSVAFWVNAFLTPEKAFLINGTTEYVEWNPKTMKIVGTVPMPELEEKSGLTAFASFVDRSVVVRDGLFYHPFYYTNDDYFDYAPVTSIAVYDVATSKLVKVIEAPCPGLDHVSQDEKGDLYFSAWTYAPAGAALLDQPSTCVAKIAKGEDTATVAFNIKDVTGGLEGGVFRYTGDGKASIAVLHPDHAADQSDVATVAFENNWKFWSYDFETNKATENDSIPWNAGSAYGSVVDGKTYILLQTEDEGTTIFDVSDPTDAKSVFKVEGWTMRLLKLR
jgi:hypothetical protein